MFGEFPMTYFAAAAGAAAAEQGAGLDPTRGYGRLTCLKACSLVLYSEAITMQQLQQASGVEDKATYVTVTSSLRASIMAVIAVGRNSKAEAVLQQ